MQPGPCLSYNRSPIQAMAVIHNQSTSCQAHICVLQEPFMGDLAFDGGLRPPKLPYPSSGSREAVQDITSLPDKNVDSRAASGRPRPTALPLRPSAPTAEPRGKGGVIPAAVALSLEACTCC